VTTADAGAARVELLSTAAVPAYVLHLCRNALESGRDGDPFSRARSADDPPDAAAIAQRLTETWLWPVTCPGWERGFGLWVDGAVRGHLDLTGGGLLTGMHRASIGMGLERPWRGAGWGTQLLTQAIAWARAVGLAWLDLGVFSGNTPARALYRKLGFVELGTTVDAFRIDGQSVDDVAMTLRL